MWITLRPAGAHDEGRLLDRVVADRDDQVGLVDRPVDIVPLRQGGRAHVEVGSAGDGALAHLGVEERQAGAAHEAGERLDEAGTVAAGADHDQRPLGRQDHLRRAIECQPDARPDGRSGGPGTIGALGRIDFLGRDVLRQFEVHRPGPLLHRDPEGIPHDGRDAGRADDLARHLGERLHRGDDVDDLEPRLPGRLDGLLPGDHDHRHGAEMRVGGARREVQRARPEGRDADAGAAGQPAVGCRHEGRGLLVPRENELDRGRAQRLDHVEVLLARDAEDAVDALVLERRNQKIRTLGHGRQLSCWCVRVGPHRKADLPDVVKSRVRPAVQ